MIGFLLIAKQRGIIKQISPGVTPMKQEGFFIAPKLEREVLVRAGEC